MAESHTVGRAAALVCTGWLLLFSGNAVAQNGRSGAISGRVLDAETSEPVGWVQLLIEEANRSTATDEAGLFLLGGIPAGIYTLKTFRIGYEPLIRTIRISPRDTLRVTLNLTVSAVSPGEIVIHDVRDQPRQFIDAAMELEGRKLRQNLGATIAETLDEEPGIAMRSMGPAPARPVLRGLGGERLLVLEDGGRTGDLSATSSDHAVVIDPMTAERIEVIRGPAALVFGSNTMGGVVNVVRGYIPSRRPDRLSAVLSLQGESVSTGYAGGFSMAAPAGPFAVHGDGSFRRGQDVSTPAGPLENTDLSTLNTSMGASFIGRNGFAGVAGSYYRSAYGIPGGFVGAHPEGVDIELDRRHFEARTEYQPNLSWIPRIEARGTVSRYHHQEFEANGVLGTEFGVLSYNGTLLAHTSKNGLFRKGGVGIWSEFRDVSAGGFVLTPDASELSLAGFAFQDVHLQRFSIQGGIRFDLRRVVPSEERESRTIGHIRTRTFEGMSASFSGMYHPAENLSLGFLVMRSLRMPGIEELYSEGPHLAAYSFQVGDPELGAERGWGTELFSRYQGRVVSASFALYRNEIRDYIFPRNTGRINVRTLLPIYQETGATAVMVGGEASGEWNVHRHVSVEGSAGYVRGTFADSSEPLPFMPPLSGRAAVRYRRRAYTVGVSVRTAAEQQRVGEFETPTDGYGVFGAFAQYHFSAGRMLHTVDLVVENMTATEYRDHLSRVKSIMPQPGRNVKVLYKVFF